MGTEYQIRFAATAEDLDRRLCSLRFYSGYDQPGGLYELRPDPSVREGMPTAWVKIEPDGLYLCDNGGSPTESAVVFQAVLDMALSLSDEVRVERL